MKSQEDTGRTNWSLSPAVVVWESPSLSENLSTICSRRTDANIGVLALEEDVATTALGIMSVASSRRLHLEEDTPVDELRPHWEATMGSGRYYLFDHWGSTSADELLSRVRHMAKACDCRYIILDHLSIVVSSQENGDERKAIDEIMTKLRTLVAETGITLFLVSHLRVALAQHTRTAAGSAYRTSVVARVLHSCQTSS